MELTTVQYMATTTTITTTTIITSTTSITIIMTRKREGGEGPSVAGREGRLTISKPGRFLRMN